MARKVSPKLQEKLDSADEIIRDSAENLQEEIDKIDRMLKPYELLKERQNRLRAAQRALLGGSRTTGEGSNQVRQEDIVRFLDENPGSRPADIAKHFGVPQPTISSHLYRGKNERFLSKNGGWWLRDPKSGINTADDIEEEE